MGIAVWTSFFRFTFFHTHSCRLTFFCFFVLFHSCSSHAGVFGKTLVHEFHISYCHTEWYLLFSDSATINAHRAGAIWYKYERAGILVTQNEKKLGYSSTTSGSSTTTSGSSTTTSGSSTTTSGSIQVATVAGYAPATVRPSGLLSFVLAIFICIFTLLFLPSSSVLFILFHFCCSHAQVFGKTLVHEFHISYSHTEWSLLFSRNEMIHSQVEDSPFKNLLIFIRGR